MTKQSPLFYVQCNTILFMSESRSVMSDSLWLQARILEYLTFPSPGELPDPEIEPRSPTLQADSLPTEPQGKPILFIV